MGLGTVISYSDLKAGKSYASRKLAMTRTYAAPRVAAIGVMIFIVGFALGCWFTWWQLQKLYAQSGVGLDIGFTSWFVLSTVGIFLAIVVVAAAAAVAVRAICVRRTRDTLRTERHKGRTNSDG